MEEDEVDDEVPQTVKRDDESLLSNARDSIKMVGHCVEYPYPSLWRCFKR